MTPQNIDLLLELSWVKYDPEHQNRANDITVIPDPEWELVSRGDIMGVESGWHISTTHKANISIWPRSSRTKDVERAIEEHLAKIRDLNPSAVPKRILPGWTPHLENIEAGEPQPGAPVRMKNKVRLDWATLVAPDSSYNSVSLQNPKNALRIDCVFEAYAQLLEGNDNFQKETRWTTYTVDRDITPDPNHPFGYGVSPSPVSSINDLKVRFQRALLNRTHDFMVRWRDAKGISLHSIITLEKAVPLKISGKIDRQISDMFHSEGLEMAYSINPYHEEARKIIQVVIFPSDNGFIFALFYGYDGSSWIHTLAETRGHEPFDQTCMRAYAGFKNLIPDLESQRVALRHKHRI